MDDEHLDAACARAACQADMAVDPSIKAVAEVDYTWQWQVPTEGSEQSAALFFNVVSIAAYAASVRLGISKDSHPPALRFVTMPDPNDALPLLTVKIADPTCLPF